MTRLEYEIDITRPVEEVESTSQILQRTSRIDRKKTQAEVASIRLKARTNG
jgi:hypothetical protein